MQTPTKLMKLDAEAENATTLSTVDHSPLSTTSDVRQMETPSKSIKIDSEAEDDTTPTKIDLSPLCNLSTIEEESLILDESMRDEVKENTDKLDSSISIENARFDKTDCEQERASVHIEVNNESDIEDRENGNETATDDGETNNETDNEEETVPPGPLNNNYLPTDIVLQIMKGPHVKLPEIPTGRKENVYFVLEKPHIEKRSNGLHSVFWDDCGAWDKAATPLSTYLMKNGRISTIVEKERKYCVEKWNKKERVFHSLEPQPAEDEVLKVHNCTRP